MGDRRHTRSAVGTVHLAPDRTECDRGQSGSVYSDNARCWTVRGSILGRVKTLFSKKYKPVVWPTQPTIQLGLKSPGQADCSPTSVAEVKNESIFICTALYAFILAHGLYLFLYRESVLCVRQGVTYPAMSDWGSSIFRARLFRLFRGGSCVTMSNVTLRGVMVQIVCIAGVH